MRIIVVFLLGLVIFNSILVFTDATGFFPGPIYEGVVVNTVNNESFTNMSAGKLLRVALGGLNPVAGIATAGIFGVAILAAIAFKSPIPLGIGGFASVFTGLWIQVYSNLEQFPIPGTLLALGNLIMGLLFVINVIEMAVNSPHG